MDEELAISTVQCSERLWLLLGNRPSTILSLEHKVNTVAPYGAHNH